EPWNQRAIIDQVGFTAATSQDVWPGHPEKVLGSTAEFVRTCPNTARAMIMAVLEASRWIDASDANRSRTAHTIAAAAYVDTDFEVIRGRMLGHYEDGLGGCWIDRRRMSFFGDGAVNFPYLSDGMWFMTQHKRWGMLAEHPDYLAVVTRVNQIALYREAATQLNIPLPAGDLRASTLIDGVVWNGRAPEQYADGFAIRHRPKRRSAYLGTFPVRNSAGMATAAHQR
ncbi:MAG: ABC transporter substrate-binding protein, partial [Propionivibrio sp.]